MTITVQPFSTPLPAKASANISVIIATPLHGSLSLSPLGGTQSGWAGLQIVASGVDGRAAGPSGPGAPPSVNVQVTNPTSATVPPPAVPQQFDAEQQGANGILSPVTL